MKNTENKIGNLSKVLLLVSAILLVTSIFKPIWRIELNAPQYPEGLELLIYADKLGGDVDIINGLNHYIGMKTLHTEDFIEFSILTYIIGFYALACLLVIFIRKKKALNILVAAFLLFGIVAMVDFYRWNYNYGHNLDPHAAIVVPGMSYQPPIIGYKQLLNFGAYSVPALGGWFFIASGVLMALAFFIESKLLKRFKRTKAAMLIAPILLIGFSSCGNKKPEDINLNTDKCSNCGMTITDLKFAAELITSKGRIYKFDDILCMMKYTKDNKEKTVSSVFYISEFIGDNHFIPAETAVFVKGENIKSPMGGHSAAFSNKDSADTFASKFEAQTTNWETLNL